MERRGGEEGWRGEVEKKRGGEVERRYRKSKGREPEERRDGRGHEVEMVIRRKEIQIEEGEIQGLKKG